MIGRESGTPRFSATTQDCQCSRMMQEEPLAS